MKINKHFFLTEPNLKLKMRVQLVNAAGLDEAGVDGGGIFREFLTVLLKTGFDPNRGFFSQTTDRQLYPNPQSTALVDDFTKHYFFLGRMIGKVCTIFVIQSRFSFTWTVESQFVFIVILLYTAFKRRYKLDCVVNCSAYDITQMSQ